MTQYAGLGAKPVGSDPAIFVRFKASEGEKWRDIVKAAQITPQWWNPGGFGHSVPAEMLSR
ncbi:hypothetical protein [Achromobacter deleyi]|uniref:hypothetical protein n=1 Tax=Achromobacter deleyi TaxID=1353891 RepID=UPI001BCA6CC2|nr:hypothetical protein [Achromobacter deleyi]QVQ26806.1 hypothetical protein HLG70_29005 [Achromobacter deleyi]UIP22380.1 hypothetical protein LYZ39_07680 [Achromobacter deleyi]